MWTVAVVMVGVPKCLTDPGDLGPVYPTAMPNERLWFNSAAPVEVGDIDMVALGMIAGRRLGTRVHPGRDRDRRCWPVRCRPRTTGPDCRNARRAGQPRQ